jgi:hypothetical protein
MLDPRPNVAVHGVHGGAEVVPRPGRQNHRGVGDEAREVLPDQEAQDPIHLPMIAPGHKLPVAAGVIKKNC